MLFYLLLLEISFLALYSLVEPISWGENFILGTFILSYIYFISLFSRHFNYLVDNVFLTRKLYFQHFYYLVNIISLQEISFLALYSLVEPISRGENFILGTFILSYTSFLDEKISFSAV